MYRATAGAFQRNSGRLWPGRLLRAFDSFARDVELKRAAGVGPALAVAKHHDFAMHRASADLKDGHRAEAGGEMVRKDRTPGINEQHVIAEFEALHVGVAADEDIHGFAAERGGGDLRDGPRLGAELVGHADAPALH